jgi:hypothetical protein
MTYDYSDLEQKFWQKELPPPPVGYSNRLGAPPIHIEASSDEN